MSTVRRVLVVSRHYWPTTTDQTLRLRAWVQQLLKHGYQPTVITPRWHPSWPSHVACEEVPIVRIDSPPISELKTSRYGRALGGWVTQQLAKFDAIYCDAAASDAYAILSQLPKNQCPPVVVRFDPRELSSTALTPSVAAWRPSPKTLETCRRASVIVVPNSAAHQQLLSTGIGQPKIHRFPDNFGRRIDRSPAARSAARMILANVNHDLFVRSQDKVIVCPGELSRDWGVDLLIQALGSLVEEQRSLKLWILGDSIERSRIYDALQFRGLHRVVIMPGLFTDLEQVLQAADLCIFPAAGRGLGWLLPTCLASSIPFAAADSPEVRTMLGESAKQLTFRANDAEELQACVRRWNRNSHDFDKAVSVARETLVSSMESYDVTRTFSNLLGDRALQPS